MSEAAEAFPQYPYFKGPKHQLEGLKHSMKVHFNMHCFIYPKKTKKTQHALILTL